MADYAQTNVQLYEQMRRAGASADDVAAVARAYALAAQLFSAQFRGSGRPFLAHLVGTASILAAHGAARDVIAAGLLHAAYESGDFGAALPGPRAASRRTVRAAVGEPVEALVKAYDAVRWPPEPDLEGQLAALDPGRARAVLTLRLANELEDALELRYAAPDKRQAVLDGLAAAIPLADSLGLPGLARELRAARAAAQALPADAVPGPGARELSYRQLPRSAKPRLAGRIAQAVRRGGRRLPLGLRRVLRRLRG